MERQYDLIAISLLMFTAVIIAAMALDPRGFSIQAWQPLIAAFVALFGARMVFRGAALSYDAALKKINLDREIHQRTLRRQARSIFLRASLATHVVQYDALEASRTVATNPTNFHLPIRIREMDTINGEVWQNLELFPQRVAQHVSDMRVAHFNLLQAQEQLSSGAGMTPYTHPPHPMAMQLGNALRELAREAAAARDAINLLIKDDGDH
ncbi:hypothetical protein [Bradyrhizobium liaoningense]|uniref:hypothetical protein n=1 Tax=Bradyrhizobium liaoningense TaxID=43992 RepID=UPI000550E595|nr:hypothetical protein [Bradyrhizobium liaoningense]